jgi:uncharacterized protein YuzE
MFKKRIIPVVGLLILMTASTTLHAQDNDWLIGNWLLTYDPDADTQDMLTFKEGGEFVTTEVATNRKVKGMYFLKSDKVLVKLVQNGKIFLSLNLTFDEKKDKLYYTSMETGNISHYTKME